MYSTMVYRPRLTLSIPNRLFSPVLVPYSQSPLSSPDVAGCVQEVFPLLLGPQGIGSSVNEIRAVAVDTLATAVKSAGAGAVRPVLPALVPVLLEALSGMEDMRLNYVEQVGGWQGGWVRLAGTVR